MIVLKPLETTDRQATVRLPGLQPDPLLALGEKPVVAGGALPGLRRGKLSEIRGKGREWLPV